MKELVVVRGGGDIATGTIYRLHRAGYKVLILESNYPSAIRRHVAFSEAVYNGEQIVEGERAVLIKGDNLRDEMDMVWRSGSIPLICDEKARAIDELSPEVVVDAILAKRNLGTRIDMAPLVIALGPGFTAGTDSHYVIETMRGHDLGRIISAGSALPNTGVPGAVGGVTKERVIHSPAEGTLHNIRQIGDIVGLGELIAVIETFDGQKIDVSASIEGVIRGLIRDGYKVTKGFKIADIDPRKDQVKNCTTISDKARNIGGSVLELISRHYRLNV